VADVAGEDLDAGAVGFRHELVGALLAGLVRPVADEQRQPGVGLMVEQLVYQLRAEKAGRAGDKDEFFIIHAGVRPQCAINLKAGEGRFRTAWATVKVILHDSP